MKIKHILAITSFATLCQIGYSSSVKAFSIPNPYRHFQHQRLDSTGRWVYDFEGICNVTSAATVAMSIVENNDGIMWADNPPGLANTSRGAEVFEDNYCDFANSVSGTQTPPPPPIDIISNSLRWSDKGGWENSPWFKGPDRDKLRVADYYFTPRSIPMPPNPNDLPWDTISTTLPNLNVVGAFALIDAVPPFQPPDFEWWNFFHVVGVHEFDFANRRMKITDSNKDLNNREVFDEPTGCVEGTPPTATPCKLGEPILTGAGVLDELLWDPMGTLTNNGGVGIDNELLISLRVLHLLSKGSSQTGDKGNNVPSPDLVPGKEYSNNSDIDDMGVPDAEQNLNWDNPLNDTFDFSGSRENDSQDRQVDALAHGNDHLFREVIENKVPLLFSTENDQRIFYEETDGSFGEWAVPPLATDVDGLEVWDEFNVFNRDDGDIYSLQTDPDIGGDRIAVWSYDRVTTSIPILTTQEIASAIGRPDLDSQIDLDAMMMLGSELMFSIAPIDIFDGGEIWVWDGVTPGGATFLNHGGHLWDTAFCVQCTFDTASENVNALEAVATPEPTSSLGLLALGTLGAASTLKRKLKSSKSPEKNIEKVS